MNTVRLDDVEPVPWRNGGGTTRELLAWPAAREWKIRISVAEVAGDGPFSNFEGVERWFAVLRGEGVRLNIDGFSHEVRRDSAPVRFDGGATVHAALLGCPTLDFNLMAPPGAATLRWEGGRLRVDSAMLAATYDVATGTLTWSAREVAR